MISRTPVAPNGRTGKSLMREFSASGDFQVKYPKSNERQTVFSYLRAGRSGQDDGASGGGRVVNK